MHTYTFYITGMHCKSCKLLIEDIITTEIPGAQATVQLREETVTVETQDEMPSEKLLALIGSKISPHGYTISTEKQTIQEKNDTLWKALPIGIAVLVLFFLLQKSGVLNFGIGGKVTPVTSFIIGLIASVSSCLAIVGGLILSLSVKISQDKTHGARDIVFFHIGRIGGFALLGGLLGILGEAIGISPLFSGILGIFAAVVMILLGIDLLGIFKNTKCTLPAGIFQYFKKIEHSIFAPLVIGLGTFFLPCGFTQSMQVASLSSGSFLGGFLIMLAFSLGTFPMLAILSFGSAGFAQSRYAKVFFQSAGVVVLGFGIVAVVSGLAGLGIIDPLISF